MESDDEEDLQALASASPDCPEVSSEASEKAPFVPRHDKLPKKNDTIQFKPTNWPDDQWFTAKVLGRAGKATGKNKNFSTSNIKVLLIEKVIKIVSISAKKLLTGEI